MDDALRVVNVALTVVCVCLMVWRLPVLREQAAPVALLLYTLGVFVVVVGYASAEALAHGSTEGLMLRVPLVTSALLLCLFGLTRFKPHQRGE